MVVQSVQPPGALEGGCHSLQRDNLSPRDRDRGEEKTGRRYATTSEATCYWGLKFEDYVTSKGILTIILLEFNILKIEGSS